MEKKIIVLAKSRKHSGYCVAGIDYETGEWIRLVSSDVYTECAVPRKHLVLDNGHLLLVYDIIIVDIVKSVGTLIQPENYLYNEQRQWIYIGKSNLEQVIQKHKYDNPSFVFGSINNSLEAETDFNDSTSLLLLHIEGGQIFIKTFEKQKIQLNFCYNNNSYSFFRITQEDLSRDYRIKADGFYPLISNSIVCSLTDIYKPTNKYYKLIAQFLE